MAWEDSSALARARSALETRFLEFCREESFPEPLVNVWVQGYLVDAYWPDANLVVELDSWEFHRGRDSFERDRAKIVDLRLAGVDVAPITDRRLTYERDKVASVIRQALNAPPGPLGGVADRAGIDPRIRLTSGRRG
jgi:very-short-patch-repair endonuclease